MQHRAMIARSLEARRSTRRQLLEVVTIYNRSFHRAIVIVICIFYFLILLHNTCKLWYLVLLDQYQKHQRSEVRRRVNRRSNTYLLQVNSQMLLYVYSSMISSKFTIRRIYSRLILIVEYICSILSFTFQDRTTNIILNMLFSQTII